MVMEIWDYVNSMFRRLRGDASGRAITLPEAQYLLDPGTLDDGEYHHLTLTVDKKLRTDDPTTQAKIDEALVILESAVFGNEALRDAITAAQEDLDNPAQYRANVAALALEATLTAMKGAGWTDETLKAIYDLVNAITAERGTDNALLAANYTPERGTDGAALVADGWGAALATILDNFTAVNIGYLDELRPGAIPNDLWWLITNLTIAMEKATGPAYNQDTDSQEAIREVCDSIVTAMS